jgi:predicted metal-dependent phosphoesterase TrpH
VSQVDLHIHSTVSDGRFSPVEIVSKAVDLGLRVISLTDHDTVNGIQEALAAAKDFPDLIMIPGVEISTDVAHGEIHILGYYIDYENPRLIVKLEQMRNSRVERARKMVDKLSTLGLKIEWERVQELASGTSIGRPHIAEALLEKGYIKSFKEAFDRYISRDGPAYVERDKMTPAEAVNLIDEVGGLPVFAHPLTFNEYEKTTGELVDAGLVGIEAYYKGSTPEEISRVLVLSGKYNLIPTGGSDFHGIEIDEINMGGVEVPMETVEKLIKLARERGLKSIGRS